MKNYPSPFAPGDRFTFSNKHGSCVLEAVTAPQPVRGVRLVDVPPTCLITWDKMEQIALITDQVMLQPVCGRDLKTKCCAFIRHATTDTAGWVRVVSLKYLTPTPARKQIAADMDAGRNRVPV